MDKPYLLHMLTAARHLSPFDVNMAYDAGWTACTPYTQVTLEEVADLTRDAIFSRGPTGAARTGIFIGGRDIHQALDMLAAARASMVPPFAVSVCADPSGAFTTAAALVAAAESWLRRAFGQGLGGQRVLVIGGTGPVGSAAAILSARAGAETLILSHSGLARAEAAARRCNARFGLALRAAEAGSAAALRALMAGADLVVNAAAAGIQVLDPAAVAAGVRLKIACDINAVPPAGIAGVGPMDEGLPIPGAPDGALGLGALAIGSLKFQVQRTLLRRMHAAGTPQYLGLEEAFTAAREQLA